MWYIVCMYSTTTVIDSTTTVTQYSALDIPMLDFGLGVIVLLLAGLLASQIW